MLSQAGSEVLPLKDKGADNPCAVIDPHRIMAATRIRTHSPRIESSSR